MGPVRRYTGFIKHREDTPMKTILYIQRINRRGPFGLPYRGFKLRVAHADRESWRRMRKRPFSLDALMLP